MSTSSSRRIKNHHGRILDILIEEHNRGHLLEVYHLKKDLIKFDIVLDILDILGHFAQREHQSPTTIKLDIIAEYHLLDFSSISGPNHLSVTSAINLDIVITAERFIRVIHLWYIYHIDIVNTSVITSISRFNHTSAIDIKAEQIISDIFAEYHLLDYICINGPNYISVIGAINLDIMVKTDRFIRTICPSHINLLINQDMVIKTERFIKTIKAEPCLPRQGNIICISYAISISGSTIDIIVKKKKFISKFCTSYIHLLYNNLDIDIKAERFIRTQHPSYIYSVKSINREAPSREHRLVLKSHRGASSMNTSEEHIIYVQDIMVKQEGIDSPDLLHLDHPQCLH